MGCHLVGKTHMRADAEGMARLGLAADSLIGARVAEMVAAVLKLDPDQVHRRRPVTAFGMDSIMAVELRNRIRVRFGVALTMVQLFTGTVDEITERVDAALMADEELAALVAEVESLPADVVAAMLSGEREVA